MLTTMGSGVYAKRSSFLNTQKRAEMEEEKITPPRMVSALPAADAASSPTDTKSLAQRALQTVVSAPAGDGQDAEQLEEQDVRRALKHPEPRGEGTR